MLKKPLLSDLEKVDPSLLTQEAVGQKEPRGSQRKKERPERKRRWQ
jgi:hypothetical protein